MKRTHQLRPNQPRNRHPYKAPPVERPPRRRIVEVRGYLIGRNENGVATVLANSPRVDTHGFSLIATADTLEKAFRVLSAVTPLPETPNPRYKDGFNNTRAVERRKRQIERRQLFPNDWDDQVWGKTWTRRQND